MFDLAACPANGYGGLAYRTPVEFCWASTDPFNGSVWTNPEGEQIQLTERQCIAGPMTDVGLCDEHYREIFVGDLELRVGVDTWRTGALELVSA
jgi:hypothetical protein